MDTVVLLLFLLSMAVGLAFLVLGLPGNFLILFAAVLYGWYGGFDELTAGVLAVMAALAVGGEVAEFALGVAGGKRWKSSNAAIAASFVAGFVGAVMGAPLLFGLGAVVGAFAGAFLGAFVVELMLEGDAARAARSALGIFLGRLGGMFVKGLAGLAMVVISVVSVIKN